MGMDLVGKKPKNAKGQALHFNWAGWTLFGDLLEELECDLSEMSGDNSGKPIRSSTCRNWAKEIRKALKENQIRFNFVTVNGFERATVSIITKHSIDSEKIKDLLRLEKTELACSERKWLEDACDFLENCGGCIQR